jgi:hypothetical protein
MLSEIAYMANQRLSSCSSSAISRQNAFVLKRKWGLYKFGPDRVFLVSSPWGTEKKAD